MNFLSIPDVTVGLDWISGVGIDLIHQRVGMLTAWLLDCLGRMRHSSGAPMVARLRAADRDRPRRHGRAELPRSGRAGDRRARGVARLERGRHLAADRLLLQPGRGRGGVRAHPAGPARGLAGAVARARRSRHGPLPVAGRPADRRRGPGLARRRLDRSTTWTRSSTSPSARTATAVPTWPPCRRGTAARRARQARSGDGSRR